MARNGGRSPARRSATRRSRAASAGARPRSKTAPAAAAAAPRGKRKRKGATRTRRTAKGGGGANANVAAASGTVVVEIELAGADGAECDAVDLTDTFSEAGEVPRMTAAAREFQMSLGPEIREVEETDDFIPLPGHRPGSGSPRVGVLKRSLTSLIHPSRDTDRFVKIIVWLVTFLYVVVVAAVAYAVDWSPSFVDLVSLVLGLVYFPYFFTWAFLLVSADEIYKVRVKMRRLEGFMPASVPYRRVVNEKRPIMSVSEAAAIRGTMMSTSLHNLSASLFAGGAIVVAYDVTSRGSSLANALENRDDATALMLLSTSVGLLCIANFDINKYDTWHTVMHYTGLALALLGSPAYGVQQQWSPLAIGLSLVQYMFGAAWVLGLLLLPWESDSVRVVTRVSKFCITAEMGVFFTQSTLSILVIQGFEWPEPGVGAAA